MPRIESRPGESLDEVWVYRSEQDAHGLLAALQTWAEADPGDPDWHHQIGSLPTGEVTIAIGSDSGGR